MILLIVIDHWFYKEVVYFYSLWQLEQRNILHFLRQKSDWFMCPLFE